MQTKITISLCPPPYAFTLHVGSIVFKFYFCNSTLQINAPPHYRQPWYSPPHIPKKVCLKSGTDNSHDCFFSLGSPFPPRIGNYGNGNYYQGAICHRGGWCECFCKATKHHLNCKLDPHPPTLLNSQHMTPSPPTMLQMCASPVHCRTIVIHEVCIRNVTKPDTVDLQSPPNQPEGHSISRKQG